MICSHRISQIRNLYPLIQLVIQWYRNGMEVPGATSYKYFPNPVSAVDGEGSDVWAKSDNGYDVYRQISGVFDFPVYLRLERVGNTFIGYFSTDGTQWVERSHQGIIIPGTIYFGVMLSRHSSGSQASAVLDRLSISSP